MRTQIIISSDDFAVNYHNIRSIRGTAIQDVILEGVSEKELEARNPALYEALVNAMRTYSGQFKEV